MSDETRDLENRVEELRREVERLEQVTDGIREEMGKMVLRGLANATVTLPLMGLTMYVAARLAQRKR